MTTATILIDQIKQERFYNEGSLNDILMKSKGQKLLLALNSYMERLMIIQMDEINRTLDKRHGVYNEVI